MKSQPPRRRAKPSPTPTASPGPTSGRQFGAPRRETRPDHPPPGAAITATEAAASCGQSFSHLPAAPPASAPGISGRLPLQLSQTDIDNAKKAYEEANAAATKAEQYRDLAAKPETTAEAADEAAKKAEEQVEICRQQVEIAANANSNDSGARYWWTSTKQRLQKAESQASKARREAKKKAERVQSIKDVKKAARQAARHRGRIGNLIGSISKYAEGIRQQQAIALGDGKAELIGLAAEQAGILARQLATAVKSIETRHGQLATLLTTAKDLRNKTIVLVTAPREVDEAVRGIKSAKEFAENRLALAKVDETLGVEIAKQLAPVAAARKLAEQKAEIARLAKEDASSKKALMEEAQSKAQKAADLALLAQQQLEVATGKRQKAQQEVDTTLELLKQASDTLDRQEENKKSAGTGLVILHLLGRKEEADTQLSGAREVEYSAKEERQTRASEAKLSGERAEEATKGSEEAEETAKRERESSEEAAEKAETAKTGAGQEIEAAGQVRAKLLALGKKAQSQGRVDRLRRKEPDLDKLDGLLDAAKDPKLLEKLFATIADATVLKQLLVYFDGAKILDKVLRDVGGLVKLQTLKTRLVTKDAVLKLVEVLGYDKIMHWLDKSVAAGDLHDMAKKESSGTRLNKLLRGFGEELTKAFLVTGSVKGEFLEEYAAVSGFKKALTDLTGGSWSNADVAKVLKTAADRGKTLAAAKDVKVLLEKAHAHTISKDTLAFWLSPAGGQKAADLKGYINDRTGSLGQIWSGGTCNMPTIGRLASGTRPTWTQLKGNCKLQDSATRVANRTHFIGGGTWGTNVRPDDGVLPRFDAGGSAITYTEYDIYPYRGDGHRGLRRIVEGSDGRKYYTTDHYQNFSKIT